MPAPKEILLVRGDEADDAVDLSAAEPAALL
jgi:hypothetical protein